MRYLISILVAGALLLAPPAVQAQSCYQQGSGIIGCPGYPVKQGDEDAFFLSGSVSRESGIIGSASLLLDWRGMTYTVDHMGYNQSFMDGWGTTYVSCPEGYAGNAKGYVRTWSPNTGGFYYYNPTYVDCGTRDGGGYN